MNRFLRGVVFGLLAVTLSAQAYAQTPNPNDAGFAQAAPEVVDDSGDPLYGYLAAGLIASICIFAVSRSSRRS